MANCKFFVLLLMVVILKEYATQAKVVDFSKDIKLQKYLKIHQCRQKCYLKTLMKTNTNAVKENLMNFSTCRGIPDCYMCYDYCQVLPKAVPDLAQKMCSDQVYCSKGCRIACSQHKILERPMEE
uniref:Uncharacterized protein n=1 Tax=Stomoxys calcitrans TaxID=35570 RepID=A0A1I8PX29_STOCA